MLGPARQNGGEQFLTLLHISNASFPTGSFSHSYGMETLIHEGTIRTPADAEARCRRWLRYAIATADAVAVAAAHRRTLYEKMDGIAALNAKVGAIKLGREAKEASLKTGAAFLAACRDVFELPEIIQLDREMEARSQPPHHAIVYGVATAAIGLGQRQAVETFLWSGFSNLITVAARLLPIGQVDLHRIIAASATLVEECAEIALSRDEDRMSSAYAGLDAASMRHERQPSRLCIS